MLVADHVIPDSELSWTFSPSGGPGGQHANRSHTRAEVRFDLGQSPSIPEPIKEHMLRRLGERAADGMVSVSSDETRSQIQNRSLATERLAAILNEAAHRPRRRKAIDQSWRVCPPSDRPVAAMSFLRRPAAVGRRRRYGW